MFIIYQTDQTAYGPFDTHTAAIAWAEETFGTNWIALKDHANYRCLYVEKPE